MFSDRREEDTRDLKEFASWISDAAFIPRKERGGRNHVVIIGRTFLEYKDDAFVNYAFEADFEMRIRKNRTEVRKYKGDFSMHFHDEEEFDKKDYISNCLKEIEVEINRKSPYLGTNVDADAAALVVESAFARIRRSA